MKKQKKEVSEFGGTLTIKQLEDYVISMGELAERDIQMYIAYHIHKKSLRQVGQSFGITHSAVRKRLNAMIGFINNTHA